MPIDPAYLVNRPDTCTCSFCLMRRAIAQGAISPGDHALDKEGQEWRVTEAGQLVPVFVTTAHE